MTAHVAILSGPGIGHLFPSSELARRLVRHHNVSVTLITQSLGSPSNTERSLIDSLREDMSVVSIPPPPPDAIPNNKNLISLLFFLSRYSVPHLRTILNSLTTTTTTPPLKALVVDMFFDEATLDMAHELGVGHYMFFTSPFILLSFALHLPALDKTYDGEYTDMPEPLKLPGYSQRFRGKDLPQPVLDRKNQVYTDYLNLAKLYYKTKGILVNSSEVLEPELLKALNEDTRIPPVYPVGPLIRSYSSDDVVSSECLRWLDEQPQGSVLYVSFGSGGTLTGEQMKELAWGLELSKQRFLWVVTKPNDHQASATYFGGQINTSSFDFLPTGFLDRTKDLVMLEEDMKVAVRAKVDEAGLVRRQEVVRLINCLIDEENGTKMRDRIHQISKATAVAVEESGLSFRSMKEVAREWIGLS
ncbi:hypothetical protein J5N97_028110 [Dioscorea zingiberensis]|uniref:Uncharacterized protein n=1 Tax=Dioscorea zingiberensis TaxID=325984 RepID=A0A9D5H4I8_9LILI|nr:hypothetical protein J5N97_028110 [Dioscorea zingiberensis]